jgi:hypothetical protein
VTQTRTIGNPLEVFKRVSTWLHSRVKSQSAMLDWHSAIYNKLGVTGYTAQEVQMIIVFTTFTLPKPITREEARSIS